MDGRVIYMELYSSEARSRCVQQIMKKERKIWSTLWGRETNGTLGSKWAAGLVFFSCFPSLFFPGWWGGGHVQRSSKVGNSFLPANQNKTCYSVSVVWDRNGQVKQAEASLCIIQTALTFSILDCFLEWMIVAGLSFGSIVIFSAGIWRWVQ